MSDAFKRFSGFLRAFNFVFGVMLLVFAASIILSIWLQSFWYLLLAVLDVAFYFAFYLVYVQLLDYYTVMNEQEEIKEDVNDIKQLITNLTNKIPVKEQTIDFDKINNKINNIKWK